MALGAVLALDAAAQPFPSRTVTLVVPFSPGTGIDILARTLSEKLASRWGHPVIVDNKAGASGNIGAEAAMKAAPDGHTLLVTATSFATNVPLAQRLPYDPQKSFVPVSLLATGMLSLVVPAASPAHSARELVELSRTRELHYASTGNGTVQHLTMELLKQALGMEMVHVPYKQNSGAIADVAGGHVEAMVTPVHTAGPLVKQNRLRMLAVLSAGRTPLFPSVPTLKETGLPDVEVDVWYAMLAPAGVASSTLQRINLDTDSILRSAEVKGTLEKQGLEPVGGPPERLARLLQSELARWARVVQRAGIKAD